MVGLLEDPNFLETYLKENRDELAGMYSYVVRFLDDPNFKIKFVFIMNSLYLLS